MMMAGASTPLQHNGWCKADIIGVNYSLSSDAAPQNEHPRCQHHSPTHVVPSALLRSGSLHNLGWEWMRGMSQNE